MNAPTIFEFYDMLSRKRALTEPESIMLEKAINAKSNTQRLADYRAMRNKRGK